MKKIIRLSLFIGVLSVALFSCHNKEVVFPDFAYTTTYFPFQYPVRTLTLGDYYFDNENDNNLRFEISATMGGVYENKEDRLVDFEVDNSLVDNMFIGSQQLLPLPSQYYSFVGGKNSLVIPKGELSGSIMVQLTDDFLNDPDAVGPTGAVYVIPVRITNSTTDSVLVGKPTVDDPDYRVADDWEVAPKNFTLFGINFVNQYHGNYLLRGKSVQEGGPDGTTVYRKLDVESDRVIEVNSASRNTVTYTKEISRNTGSSPGDFTMLITFDDQGNGQITKDPSSGFDVTGTAKFVKDAESWGGKPRSAIYLDYVVNDGTYLNTAKDTLVYRDKGVYFQEFKPVYKP